MKHGNGGIHLMGVVVVAALFWAVAPVESPVADAAMRGETEMVRALLRGGADVNAAQGDGMTALHWAAEHGNTEMTEMLILAGANFAAVTRIGDYTPLHLAAKAGQAGTVEVLLEAGSNPNVATTTGGATAIHFAATSGSDEAVRSLIEHGADVNARESARGQTSLMFAAAYDRSSVVDALLENGADVGLTSKVVDLPTRQAADRAAGQRRNEVLEAFRAEARAEGAWRPDPSQIQAAVHAAQQLEQVDLSEPQEEPVDFDGAEPTALSYPDLVGGHGGMTALLYAVREGHVATTMALLDGGADINQMSMGDHTSPMLMTLINGHFDLALQLLERGGDPNLASDAGTTPLYAALNTHWAPKARYPQQQAYQQQQSVYMEVMKQLLDAGADPNARLTKHLWYMSYTFDLLRVDTKGATPFWRAAYATDVEAMTLLFEYGADPGIATEKMPQRRFGRRGRQQQGPDPSGLPPVPVGGPAVYPIHAASGVGYGEGYAANAHRHVPGAWVSGVRYLVEEHGADVNARDLNGYTPLHHAAARGDNDLIRYLVEQGAAVTAVSRRGQTTADMANGPVQRIQPFPETVALLESLGSENNHNCVSC